VVRVFCPFCLWFDAVFLGLRARRVRGGLAGCNLRNPLLLQPLLTRFRRTSTNVWCDRLSRPARACNASQAPALSGSSNPVQSFSLLHRPIKIFQTTPKKNYQPGHWWLDHFHSQTFRANSDPQLIFGLLQVPQIFEIFGISELLIDIIQNIQIQ
jgi:hypothetical protein